MEKSFTGGGIEEILLERLTEPTQVFYSRVPKGQKGLIPVRTANNDTHTHARTNTHVQKRPITTT